MELLACLLNALQASQVKLKELHSVQRPADVSPGLQLLDCLIVLRLAAPRDDDLGSIVLQQGVHCFKADTSVSSRDYSDFACERGHVRRVPAGLLAREELGVHCGERLRHVEGV